MRTGARWRERSLERALERAKRRSHEQTSAFVAAARALAVESAGLDFTVQAVVERAHRESPQVMKSFREHQHKR